MRTIITSAAFLLLGTAAFAQNTYGDIIGTLVDSKTKGGFYDATVLTMRGEAIYREKTDPDGRFRISAVPAGIYKVMFIYGGDTVYAPKDVEVVPDGYGDVGKVEFAQTQKSTDLGEIKIIDKIVLTKGEAPVSVLKAKDIKYSPDKFNVKGMVVGMNPEVRQTEDGSLVFRGARKGDLIYYIDGVKMNDVFNPPSSAINYIMVYSGAIPAKYGDTNGGVIVVETKGYFDMLREYNSMMSLGQ
jgi:hypothetical protein